MHTIKNIKTKYLFLAIISLLSVFVFTNTTKAESNNIEWIEYPSTYEMLDPANDDDITEDNEEEQEFGKMLTGEEILATTDIMRTLNDERALRGEETSTEYGIGHIKYKGKTLNNLKKDLTSQGCNIKGIWIYNNNEWNIYHLEAPDFINKPFIDKYSNNIPSNITITIQCYNPENIIKETESNIQDYNLDKTKIKWITYPSINTERNKQGSATIQYGGGSFYKLISRLSVEGCEAISLTINNTNYDFRKSNQHNKQFKDKYNDNIQQNTNIEVMCVDRCDIILGLDLVKDYYKRERIKEYEKCIDLNLDLDIAIEYLDCHTDWSDRIKKVLQVMPMYQDVCRMDILIDQSYFTNGSSIDGVLVDGNVLYSHFIPRIHLYHYVTDLSTIDEYQFDTPLMERVILHELCHMHQFWYTFKNHTNYDFLKDNSRVAYLYEFWDETQMAKELNEILGFEKNDNGKWVSVPGSISYPYYKDHPNHIIQPIEVAANACTGYFIDNLLEGGSSHPLFVNTEVEQWVEKYIIVTPQS